MRPVPYFVDSCFFVSLMNKGDDNHEKAQEIFVDISNGVYGKLIASWR